MKFMDRVITPAGPGLVIGISETGKVLVSIARRELVGKACQGPNLAVWVNMDQVQMEVAMIRPGMEGGCR